MVATVHLSCLQIKNIGDFSIRQFFFLIWRCAENHVRIVTLAIIFIIRKKNISEKYSRKILMFHKFVAIFTTKAKIFILSPLFGNVGLLFGNFNNFYR